MKKTLLMTFDFLSKTSLRKFQTTSFISILVLFLSFTSTVRSQFICGPYKGFESFGNGAAITGGALGNLKEGIGSTYWTTAGAVGRSATSYSGAAALQFTSATSGTDAITTPLLTNIDKFQFVYRTGTLAATSGFRVQWSSDGVSWPAGQILSTITTTNAAYATAGVPQYYQYNFSTISASNPLGIYIRVVDARGIGTGKLLIDDMCWTSTVASENTKIVALRTLNTQCSANYTQNLQAGVTYTFFDNGGEWDSYNLSQNNTVTFMPPAGYNVNFSLSAATTVTTSDAICTDSDWLKLYDGSASGTLLNWIQTGCGTRAVPGSTLVSSACDGSMTAQFKSDATAVAAAALGCKITITTTAATCPPVTGVMVASTSITSTGGTLSWTPPCSTPASGYDYYVSTSATAPLSGDTPTGNTTSSSVLLNTLSSNTTYYAWVRTNCGVGFTGSWVQIAGLSFKTLCSGYGLPYRENFNGLNLVLPTCTSTDSPGNWQTNIVNGNLFGNTAGTRFYGKPINLVGGNVYRLTYDFSTILGTADFTVYYGTTNNPPTSSNINTLLFTHTGVSALSTNVVNFTAPSNGIYYLAFQLDGVSSAGNTQLNLDNIILEDETCLPPSGLTVSGVLSTSASLSWTASTSLPSSGYQYYLSTSPTTPTYGVSASGSTGAGVVATTLGGLTASTTFYVWVRSNCTGTYSNWSAVTSFTTAAGAAAILINGAGPTTSCDVNFFDTGGSAANYFNSETNTYTFYPATAGSKLKIVFSSFNTESGYDGLSIYNGNSTAAPLISSGLGAGINATTCPAGSWYGTTSPGTLYSTAADGSLTFKFTTDTSVVRSGWAAALSCVTLPTVSSFTPNNNNCTTGTSVVITGTNFSSPPITSVTFAGTAATFVVNSATQITATLPGGATTGPIAVSNAQATGTSTSDFTVLSPPPSATGVTVCRGTTGFLTSPTVCSGFANAGTSISGGWNAGSDPVADRLNSVANSTVCGFASGLTRNYVATQFQVSVTGTYTLEMVSGQDGMGYITKGAFTPGSCATGTFVVGDDDSGAGVEPQLSTTLTAGVTYTLYSTTYGGAGTYTGAFTWNVTTSTGGQIMLFTTSQIQWYTGSGVLIGLGSSFNPMNATNSGLTTASVAGTYPYYAACSINPTCRTLANYILNDKPTVTLTAGGALCANAIKTLTVSGTATTYAWSTSVPGTLFTDSTASTPYVSGSYTTLYVKTTASVTITVTGTITATTCATTTSSVFTVINKTWNGSGWDGDTLAPNANESITIAGDLSTSGNLQACSCTITSGTVTVNSGHTLTLQDDLNVAGGSLTFEDGASLVQVNTPSTNTNSGAITYKRNTTMRKFDYTYWSSPVFPQTLSLLSPMTLSDKYFWWNATSYSWTGIAAPALTNMTPGQGYIIRGPQDYSTTVLTPFIGSFIGVPNNGDYTANVIKSGLGDLNLLGNPYPSAVDADLFVSGNAATFTNAGVTGTTFYFWTHNTPITNNAYTFNDYATYNFSGGVASAAVALSSPCVGCNNGIPTGKIAAGQGFMVKGVKTGTFVATFKNNMRLVGNNGQFFRQSQSATATTTVEKNRLWLELKNEQGAFKQALIAYVPNASNGFEMGYDGEMIDAGNPVGFYSTLEGKKLAIQGRALPFDAADLVPMGYKIPVAGNYSISLSNTDGLFADASVGIYLEDHLLNVIHDLRTSAYDFVSEVGTFDSRFVVRYTNSALAVNPFTLTENGVVVYKQNETIQIETANSKMKSVQIYDVRGRLILERENINASHTAFEGVGVAHQVLLVQIKSVDGTLVNKKIIF